MKNHILSKAVDIFVSGVVQGVGFRPFVFRTAMSLGYKGWVKNAGDGVEIHLEKNSSTDFQDFTDIFFSNLPPLAQVEHIHMDPGIFRGCREFKIEKTDQSGSFVFISPDIAVCEACRLELFDPADRRFKYPFINCTDCGPRYTIVHSLPYDRPKTTMAEFAMCSLCNQEYSNPMDRRYHAQPIACPECGPRITLTDARLGKNISGGISEAAVMIEEGLVLAVKGLGGFHLVCNPHSIEAVNKIRTIKARRRKPLALMARDLEVVKTYAHVNDEEAHLLLSPFRPIVLLRKKQNIPDIAPYLNEIGFMLPYTPLHALLLEKTDLIVATSSNRKDSPIIKDRDEGVAELCDIILDHNRPIHMRADDSVLKEAGGQPLFLRRARGYVPHPQKVHLPATGTHILALGGELKDTISIYKNGYVVTSQFLGDLEDYQNFQYFEETITHLTHLFGLTPEVIVCDLHPDFHTTRYAQRSGLRFFQVQHHFAHILAPMLEHGIPQGEKVLGVCLDGYGYGDDGSAWGGEFLICDYEDYQRFAHFKYIPLPGGDLASRQPWRMALAYLHDLFGDKIPQSGPLMNVEQRQKNGVLEMIRRKVNSPFSSSCGRLFDAVSFLAGLAPLKAEFEAEAPMRLESAVDPDTTTAYEFRITGSDHCRVIDFKPTIRSVFEEQNSGESPKFIAARFHNTLAEVILSVAEQARREHGLKTIALVGGVFCNKTLLIKAQNLLREKKFNVIRPLKYSPNDESLSIGQIAYALNRLSIESVHSDFQASEKSNHQVHQKTAANPQKSDPEKSKNSSQ